LHFFVAKVLPETAVLRASRNRNATPGASGVPGWTPWPSGGGSHQLVSVETNRELLKIAIEIVDFPIKNGDFP
jgi:hypothetical protein